MIQKKFENIIFNYLIKNKNKLKINSKDLVRGDVFLCLKGKKTHGNKFIKEAIQKNVKYIITNKKFNFKKYEEKILIVNDVLKFIFEIATIKRNIFKGKVIGVTGSAGKTSVKENLNFFLSSVSNVSVSIKSYNNYLGVLLSLTNIDLNSNFAVLEIGTNNFNEIKTLTSIVKPDQAIITNIFPTHLENFKSTRNVAKEKSDIFNSKINSNIKLAIIPKINSDELFLFKKAKENKISKIYTIGNKNNSNFYIKKIQKINNKISKINFVGNGKKIQFTASVSQYYEVHNLLICFIIFQFNKLNLKIFYKNALKINKLQGRGLENKIYLYNKKVTLIDESYNASPSTMEKCINYFDNLKIYKNSKKFLILGDMNELGTKKDKFHKEVIKNSLDKNIDYIILCGPLFKSALHNININKKNIFYISNEINIMDFLKDKLHNNDTILIKCSNSTKVNNFAKMILDQKGRI